MTRFEYATTKIRRSRRKFARGTETSANHGRWSLSVRDAIQCDSVRLSRLFVLDRLVTKPLHQRLNLVPVAPVAVVHVHHGAAFLAPR